MLKKCLMIFFTVCIMFTAVSIPVYATSATSWDDVEASAKAVGLAYVQAACDLASSSDGSEFAGSYLSMLTDIPLAWLDFYETIGWYISPTDDVYYYLKDGVLWVYEGALSSASGSGGHSRVGGAGAQGRLRVPADTFNDIVNQLNEHYSPKDAKSMVSWRTDSRYSIFTDALTEPRLSFFYEGEMFGNSWIQAYLMPFYYDGSVYRYSQYTLHLYQVVTQDDAGANVISMYVDYIDNEGNVDKSELISSSVATVRYWDFCQPNSNRLYFQGYNSIADYANKKRSSPIVYISNGDCDVSTFYTTDLSSYVDFDLTTDLKYHFQKKVSDHTCDVLDDIGYFISDEPISVKFNIKSLPSDTYITYQGDNIYNYTITNPSTGQSTTINNFITNNYYFPENDDDDNDNTTDEPAGGLDWDISFDDFIVNIGDSITNSLSEFTETIGDTISTSIENTFNYLFVPSENYYNDISITIENAINEKIPWVTDLNDIFSCLFIDIDDVNFAFGENPNDTYVDENGMVHEVVDGKYMTFGTELKDFYGHDIYIEFLNLGDFKELLPYVRAIALLFIYLAFIMRMVKYMPTLIGEVADVGNANTYAKIEKPKKGQ